MKPKNSILLIVSSSLIAFAPMALGFGPVVAAWDSFDNTPNYVAGADLVDQSGVAPGERFGTVFNVLTIKGDTVKQASRQSTDGTFGSATGLTTWYGDPIAPDTATNSALRINDGQQLELQFVNVSGGEVQLGWFLFDYGRSNDGSPQTITVSLIDSLGVSTVLLSDSSTPNTGSIGNYSDFDVDLRAFTISNGDFFTIQLAASNGGTGGNIDNTALTVIPEPATLAAFFGVLALFGALARRRLVAR